MVKLEFFDSSGTLEKPGYPTHAFRLQGNSPAVIGWPVRVPATFDALIEEAGRELASR